MEIVQTRDRVFQFFEWGHSYRQVWTDGRPLPKDVDLTFNGISTGQWAGDTFVVTSGFSMTAAGSTTSECLTPPR